MTATVPPDDTESCPCGSPWWLLEQDPNSALTIPAFTLSREGKITGWSGRPACVECGTPWAPARDRLSVVDDSPGGEVDRLTAEAEADGQTVDGYTIDGGVLDLAAVRDQLVAPDPPTLIEAAREAKNRDPVNGDWCAPIPDERFEPPPPRRPRVRHVVLAYDRGDFAAWRSLGGGRRYAERDVIPVFTNSEGGAHRLRGIDLTDDDVIHHWTRCGAGAFINEAMNELAFASRNRTQS